MIFITKRSDMSSISVEVSNFDERLYDNMYEFIEDYVTEMNTLYDEKKTKYFLILDTKISDWYEIEDSAGVALSGMHDMTRAERNGVTEVIEQYPDLAAYLSI